MAARAIRAAATPMPIVAPDERPEEVVLVIEEVLLLDDWESRAAPSSVADEGVPVLLAVGGVFVVVPAKPFVRFHS